MVQKPKEPEEMPGLKKAEPARKFAEREKIDRIATSYDVQIIASNLKNDAVVRIMKEGRLLGHYSIEEGESGVIDNALVITNLGGSRFRGTAMSDPEIYISYIVPLDTSSAMPLG